MSSMTPDLLEIADELYALPLADFTPARDAKAKELKGTDLAARGEGAEEARRLAAWVVNLLVRREGDQVDQVLAVGAALREAAGVAGRRGAARADQAAPPADRGRHHPGPRVASAAGSR